MEELKTTKLSIDAQIESEEAEKSRLQRELERISGRISQLNESLGKKTAARADYERTIQETESAYMKILESSQLLLNMVKREAACLDQTLSSSSRGSVDDVVDASGRYRRSKETVESCEDGGTCHRSQGDHIRRKRAGDVLAKT